MTGAHIEPIKIGRKWYWVVTEFEDDTFEDGDCIDVRESAPTRERLTPKPMVVTVTDCELRIARNAGKRAKNESQLYYWIKEALRERGIEVIKKLMVKDRILTDERRYYLRGKGFAYVDDYYDLRNLAKSFNDGLTMTLRKVYL